MRLKFSQDSVLRSLRSQLYGRSVKNDLHVIHALNFAHGGEGVLRLHVCRELDAKLCTVSGRATYWEKLCISKLGLESVLLVTCICGGGKDGDSRRGGGVVNDGGATDEEAEFSQHNGRQCQKPLFYGADADGALHARHAQLRGRPHHGRGARGVRGRRSGSRCRLEGEVDKVFQ